MHRLTVARYERHAIFTARHQYRLTADETVDLGRRRDDLGVAVARPAESLRRAPAVRRDQCGTP